MRKLKTVNTGFEKSEFMINYLKEKYGESWHLGNNKHMYERYEEAEKEYNNFKENSKKKASCVLAAWRFFFKPKNSREGFLENAFGTWSIMKGGSMP